MTDELSSDFNILEITVNVQSLGVSFGSNAFDGEVSFSLNVFPSESWSRNSTLV